MDTVVTGLDGSNDHNSGRLRISPIPESDGNYHLYYTIGDMGAGQLANICRAEFAQDTTVIEGKSLRFNTEPDPVTACRPSNGYRRTILFLPRRALLPEVRSIRSGIATRRAWHSGR